MVGPGMCMSAEPKLVRTSLRRAAASTSPSLGWLSCRLTSPPQCLVAPNAPQPWRFQKGCPPFWRE
eukprot:7442216-Pyramimonas_sp.AAC.1